MTQAVAIHDDKKNAVQKIVHIAKPGYVEKGFNELEALQQKDGKLVNPGSRWGVISKKLSRKTCFISASTFAVTFPFMSSMIFLFGINGNSTATGVITSLVAGAAFGAVPSIMFVPSFYSEDKKVKTWKKLQNVYKDDIKEWLNTSYNITVDEAELEEITAKILRPDTIAHCFKDSVTGCMYEMRLDETDSTWNILTVNSLPAVNAVAIEAPATTDPHIEAVYANVNQKIATLKNFPLNADNHHLFTKAVNDTRITMNLVQQLHTLGDVTYLEQAEQAFALIETSLDTIIESQKTIITAQLHSNLRNTSSNSDNLVIQPKQARVSV